jgi:hypothetical protein
MRQTAYCLAVLQDGPYLYAPLDDSPGEGVSDRSGNGRGAVNGSAFTQAQPPIAPGLGRSTSIQDWLSFPDPPLADVASGGSYSVEVWLSPTGNAVGTSGYAFWGTWSATQNRTWLGFGIGNSSFDLNTANGSQGGGGVSGLPVIVVGGIYHLVFTADANTTCNYYVNGQCVGTAAQSSGTRQNSGPSNHRLGRNPDTFWGAVLGYYSNFAYYSGRALSADRIWTHYQLGRGNYRSRVLRRTA